MKGFLSAAVLLVLAGPSAAACTTPHPVDHYTHIRVEESGQVLLDHRTSQRHRIPSCDDQPLAPPQFDGRYVIWIDANARHMVDLDADRTVVAAPEGTLGDGVILNAFFEGGVMRVTSEYLSNGSRRFVRLPDDARFVSITDDLALATRVKGSWHDPFNGTWLWDGSDAVWRLEDVRMPRIDGVSTPILVAANDRWILVEDRMNNRTLWAIDHVHRTIHGPVIVHNLEHIFLVDNRIYLESYFVSGLGRREAGFVELPDVSGQAGRYTSRTVGDRIASRLVGAPVDSGDDAPAAGPIPLPGWSILVALFAVVLGWRQRR